MAIHTTQSLLWRFIPSPDQSATKIAFVIPEEAPGEKPDVLFETGIHIAPAGAIRVAQTGLYHADESWSAEDIELLVTLMDRMFEKDEDDTEEDISIDLTDPSVAELISIVASARFKKPQDLTEVHLADPVVTEFSDYETGDLMTVKAGDQFFLLVVVSLDSVQASCVALEDIHCPEQGVHINTHDLFMLSRMDLYPAGFGSVFANDQDVIH